MSERSKLESGLTLPWLSMVGIAVVALFVCAAALLATAEFLYRHKEKNVRKRPLFWEFWFSLVQPETLVRRTPCPPTTRGSGKSSCDATLRCNVDHHDQVES